MGRSLLELLEPHRISDTVWGEAYERTGALKRSRLKQTIARSHALLDAPVRNVVRQVSLGQGGEHVTSIAPCDWSLVLVGNGFVEPTRFLAAAVYPAMAGVRDVLIARESGPAQLPDSFLSGLELGGVENFAECCGDELSNIIYQAGTEEGRGVLLTLGSFSPEVEKALCEVDLPVCRLSRPGGVQSIGVFIDDECQWDWECLVWAFPEAEYLLAGKGGDQAALQLPESAAWSVCREEDLFSGKCDLLLYPVPLRAEQAAAPVCLGPGQEGVWVWPQLHESMFQHVRLHILS